MAARIFSNHRNNLRGVHEPNLRARGCPASLWFPSLFPGNPFQALLPGEIEKTGSGNLI
ncbi:MAG: hypothetical protein JXB88_11805 [Spirochaetales bacterium]|nr:hypothetical protein [Spirochaetales bacterium]